jgi:DNA-binding XRE family transcriptional regulator
VLSFSVGRASGAPPPRGLFLINSYIISYPYLNAIDYLYNSGMARWQTVDGERLRELREDRMFSQTELAKMAGITQAAISGFERGERKAQPRTVRHLAEALGVPPRALLKREG